MFYVFLLQIYGKNLLTLQNFAKHLAMQIFINDKIVLIDKNTSLQDVLQQENLLHKQGIAVAVNTSIIQRKVWEALILKEGDRVDVITAFYGG
jgi:thiamine biosynthesis protein ThiS